MMIIIPFWTNSLVRIYGWRTFLSATGQLNTFLMAIGATSEPIQFLYNQACTVFGMAYDMFPFMVLPLYAAIEKLDESQIEASFDLGANMLTTIFKVVIPQTMSGIFSGCIMVFIPSLARFISRTSWRRQRRCYRQPDSTPVPKRQRLAFRSRALDSAHRYYAAAGQDLPKGRRRYGKPGV